ncbi:hypothetical protein [Anabaena azotica]|uniref:PIN domain-containing protein n=1 Tax=Anabaena azotica FACHB-119 TaxID=947527 RepID=A0ABR8CYQ1_9NOST|nr:hypothetical protein [Anabaena azotica]MBD2499207.1 hypothetical protein [Anabaena azotica FACHB-119]
MVGVVLDACVLFPMYLRDTLLSIAEAGWYMPYWSQKILDEAISNLVINKKISSDVAKRLEGEQYRISHNRGVLTISAKDGRGKILQFEYGKVEGKLTSADIEAFQIFEQTLEQELALVQKQKSKTL